MGINGLNNAAELSEVNNHDFDTTLADVNENGNKMGFFENMVMGPLRKSLHFFKKWKFFRITKLALFFLEKRILP